MSVWAEGVWAIGFWADGVWETEEGVTPSGTPYIIRYRRRMRR
jgi:hypothetical protein